MSSSLTLLYKVAVAYAVVAWLLIQIAKTIVRSVTAIPVKAIGSQALTP